MYQFPHNCFVIDGAEEVASFHSPSDDVVQSFASMGLGKVHSYYDS